VACWSTKAAISLKRVKIEEKLLWRAYIVNALSNGTISDPLRPPLPQDWGFAFVANISGTDFKFGRCIHSVLGRKRSVGVSRGCANFLNTPYYLRNG